MKIAISQPTYLPWLGYLDLIDQADTFVFLDTVQFEKRSWQQRNRIKAPGGLCILTVPVAVKGRFEQKIKDVEIEDSYFVRKHLRSLEANYRRAPFFSQYFSGAAGVFGMCTAGTRLVDLNIQLIQWLCKALGITTPLLRSSQVNQLGVRSELLLNLCRTLNADCYVSTPGSSDYLLNDIPQFSAAGIEVVFQQYNHPKYRQQFPPFQSHASAIDLIFNEGGRSLDILRSGRQAALHPAEIRVCEREEIAGA